MADSLHKLNLLKPLKLTHRSCQCLYNNTMNRSRLLQTIHKTNTSTFALDQWFQKANDNQNSWGLSSILSDKLKTLEQSNQQFRCMSQFVSSPYLDCLSNAFSLRFQNYNPEPIEHLVSNIRCKLLNCILAGAAELATQLCSTSHCSEREFAFRDSRLTC